MGASLVRAFMRAFVSVSKMLLLGRCCCYQSACLERAERPPHLVMGFANDTVDMMGYGSIALLALTAISKGLKMNPAAAKTLANAAKAAADNAAKKVK